MATGANTTPLGRMSHNQISVNTPKLSSATIGGGISGSGSSLLKPSYLSGKRDHDSSGDTHPDYHSSNWPLDYHADRKKKRRSRWGGDDKDKVFIPGMPTVLPNNLSANQEKAYLLQLQIEEISRRLRTGDLGIPLNPEERSPSPEPIYNSEGKRLNTREYRTRKKLEDDRHSHIQDMFKVNPEYKPPADYKPPMVRVCEKVMIPQDEHPDINFVGLLIGPRGNTLKSMEKETGAKIIIRGKGSVKEGKVGRKDGQPLPGEDEPLHAFVTATNPDAVKRAVDRIKEIIRQGVEVPEGQNDLRRMQLRELALLNGTLRENEGPRCTNCGAANHRSWQCPDKPNITNNVICTNCGGAGHIARDCREKKSATTLFGSVEKSKIDEEYMSLMAELGEGPPPPAKSTPQSTPFMAPNPLSAPQGPMRAIMAPPPNTSMSAVPPPWLTTTTNSSQMNKPQMMNTAGMLLPPPMMAMPPSLTGVPPPPGTAAPPPQMPLMPWQQQPPPQNMSGMGIQGVPPPPGMMSQPPPPPGSQNPTSSMPWMTMGQQHMSQGGMAMQMAWQQQQPPPPVPPPGQGAGQNPGGFPWVGFMGVPPPPPVQPPIQPPLPPGLAIPPPPPPPPLPTTSGSGMDLSAVLSQGLPNLLAAPPPPPPPPS